MDLGSALPQWLPWWMAIAIAAPAAVYALLFLAMPFRLYGLRSRIDGMEARLDELHHEIRTLVLRLPENPDEIDYALPPVRRPSASRPPIPPPAAYAAPDQTDPRAEFRRPREPSPEPPAPVARRAVGDATYIAQVYEQDDALGARPQARQPAVEPPRVEPQRVEPPRGWRPPPPPGDGPPPPPPPPRSTRIERPLGGWDNQRRVEPRFGNSRDTTPPNPEPRFPSPR